MKFFNLKQVLSLFILVLGSHTYAQKITFQPLKPVEGRTLEVSYDAHGGDLEFSDEVKASGLLFKDFEWHQVMIPLERKDNRWNGTLSIPQGSALLALRFFQGDPLNPDINDHNKEGGYLLEVKSGKGQVKPGRYLALALLKNQIYDQMILSRFASIDTSKVLLSQLLEQEKTIPGSSSSDYLSTYLDLKRRLLGEQHFMPFAQKVLEAQLHRKEVSEEKLFQIYEYYKRSLKDTANAAKVSSRIISEYPKSSSARFIIYQQAMNEKNVKSYQLAMANFLSRFPLEEWRKRPDKQEFIYYTTYRSLATSYFDSGKYDDFLSLFKGINFKTANEIYRWNVMRAEMGGKVDKSLLLDLSKKIIPYLLERIKDGSYLTDFDDKVAAQLNADKQFDERLFTYIKLAMKNGDFRLAKSQFQYISAEGRFADAELNAMHMEVLARLGDTDEILPLLEQSAKRNALTPLMLDRLKLIYIQKHNGSDVGYQAYFDSLKSLKQGTEMIAHIKENMVNFPLKPFSLEDASGKMVSSALWENKIVVLDFWATWCRPCIMAFPGMQLLVDKYASDPTVEIYMVGTMQTGDYKHKSVEYVKKEGFRFNLLHDAVSSEGGQDKLFKSLVPYFKSSAIPRKIIVKNGVVRYSSEGYSGSPSQLMDELSTAIEMIRNEK